MYMYMYMLQTRQKVFRIVPKCPERSQYVQFRRIVVRTDMFYDFRVLLLLPNHTRLFSRVSGLVSLKTHESAVGEKRTMKPSKSKT